MKSIKSAMLLGLCFATALPVVANDQKPTKMVAAFDKASPGKELRAKAPDYIDKEVIRVSPDGKYVARLTVGEGEVGSVTLYRNQGSKNRFLKKFVVSATVVDVGGCIWVPRHLHWFAFSTSDAYGEASMGLWTGSKKVRWLRRGQAGTQDQPDAEGFNIRGASTGGRTLIYEHFGSNSPDPRYQRNSWLYFNLPRS